MSTEENKQLVGRFVREVFQNLRLESLDELVGESFVSHTWQFPGDAREGLKKVTGAMGAALSDIEFTVDDLIAEDDRVAARLTASATQTGEFQGLPPSGRRYTIGEIHIFRIAQGKIVEHWHQYDKSGLMSQLSGEK
jgi:steroid delta-isomerase-like uncharacterized protein